jgi:predicted permease
MREWLARIHDWFRRDTLDHELAEELRFHQQLLERDAVMDGNEAVDAPRVARRRLGNVTNVRESARDRWSVPWLDHFLQDARYAVRGLRRSPGFTATVMLTLGLGIGANAAMFGVIDRLMFRPFPYLRDPASVNRVYLQTTSRGSTRTANVIPYARYLDLRRFTSSFSQYAGVTEWQLAVGTGDATRERQVAGVNASFFGFFDARPALGHFFGADEDSIPRGANVAVVSHGYWKSQLGGGDVVGRPLQVGPLVMTIVGVTPEGFVGVSDGEPPDVFVPITTIAYAVNQGHAETFPTFYNWDWMSVMVRRKPGVTAAAASADLTHAFALSRSAQRLINPLVAPDSIARPQAIAGALKTAAGPAAGIESKTLLWVGGVAVIVLLIACANVANLMFARVLRRRREIAVRLSLGVSRRRLMAQYLTESLILATLACTTGLVIAQWVSAALRQMLVRDGSSAGLVTDWRTFGVACGIALLAALVTSIGPALLGARADLATALRAGAREGTYQRSRTRSALLILQGALSVVLLVGAGLFVRSLNNVRSLPLGWNPEPVLVVVPNLRGLQMDTAAQTRFRRTLLAAAQSIPGVASAARVNAMPFGTNTLDLHVRGIDSVQRLGRFNYQVSSPDFFNVIGTRIVRGRSFTAEDRGEAGRVAVVSSAMGNTLWPHHDPIGQCLYLGAETAPCTRIIGVAEDAVQYSITDNARLMYYLSDEHPEPIRGGRRLFLRMSNSDAPAQAERVRLALQRVMPGQGYITVSPLEDLVDTQRRSWKLGATMFVAFGVLALVVAAVGLYGVITYTVAQRMHELGVRIALGAQSRDIVRLVVAQGISFATAGVALGLGAALLAARWVQPILFQESARDPAIFVSVGMVIAVVALLASAAPALRATRADPNTALRSD